MKCGEERVLENFLAIDYGPDIKEGRVREGRHVIRKVKPEPKRRRHRGSSRAEARKRYERSKAEIIAFFRKSGGCQHATALQFDMPSSSLRQRLIAWGVIGQDGKELIVSASITLLLRAHTEAVIITGDAALVTQLRAMITSGSITVTAQASRLLPYEYFLGEKNDATL